MFPPGPILCLSVASLLAIESLGQTSRPASAPSLAIATIDPPRDGFFAKRLDYDGIAILASKVVMDDALVEAHRRLETMLQHQPNVRLRLARAGAELHIIGRDQQTSDLPEWQHMKGKPFDGELTIDQRTRGMGGRLTSCGEENLLKLRTDRYRGRDICVHEFAHCVLNYGVSRDVRDRVVTQFQQSTSAGLWKGSYAGSNKDEFFAELTMWYFGTHGDMGMAGTKPANGPEGLKAYDPEAFRLMDDFYTGRLSVPPPTTRPQRGNG